MRSVNRPLHLPPKNTNEAIKHLQKKESKSEK